VALSGGSNVLSDAVAEIDAAGRRLFERTLPPVDGGRVRGVGVEAFPDRVVCDRPADGAAAVAAFNWTDEPRTLRVDPGAHVDPGVADDAGADDLPYAWDALVADRPVGDRLSCGPIERRVPPHGCLLVHCAPAGSGPEPRPTLVGATHLANATSQVTAVERDDGAVRVTLDADAPMELVVATPGGRRPADPADAAPEADEQSGSDGVATVVATPGPNEFRFE
jgi:alpha-galactosidase